MSGELMDKLDLILARVLQRVAVTDGHVKNLWNSADLIKLINPSGLDTLEMILKRGTIEALDRAVLTAPLVFASTSCDIAAVKMLLEYGATYTNSQEAINFIRDFLSAHNSYGHWGGRFRLIKVLIEANEATKEFVLEHSYNVDINDSKLVALLVGAGADIYRGSVSIHAKMELQRRHRYPVVDVVPIYQFVNPLFAIMLKRVNLNVAPASGGDKRQRK